MCNNMSSGYTSIPGWNIFLNISTQRKDLIAPVAVVRS